MATMREVAAHARVSQKTVSRVFNDDPQVRPEARERVLRAMAELDYVPNPMAKAFRSGRSPMISLAVPDLLDPFFAAIVRAADEEAHGADMCTSVTSLGEDPAREPELIRSMLRRAPSGVIIAPISGDQSYLSDEAPAVPVVFVDRPPTGLSADTIRHDDAAGARMAMSHFQEQGHRRIAFVGDRLDLPTTRSRLGEYLRSLRRAGLPTSRDLIRLGVIDRGSAERAVAELVQADDPPSAVFSSNARASMLLVPALQHSPMALVSFGDFPMAESLTPPVCAVAQDPEEIGRRAARLILQRLGQTGGAHAACRDEVLPVRMVERASCRQPSAL